jgi:lipoprotein-anchoring transpeptidase ErfK/SrfK
VTGARRWALVAALAVALAVVTGCGGHDQAAKGGGAGTGPGHTATTKALAISTSPRPESSDVPLDAPVTVSLADARLTSVIVSTWGGAPIAGAIDPTTGQWKSTEPLAPATKYSVSATAMVATDQVVTKSWTFTTLTPAKSLKVRAAPLNGATVGVGQPLAVYLTAPVTDKAALLARLQVTTTPAVEGAWHWFSSTELHWRPENFWAAGTKVSMVANLAGWNAGNGVWGVENRTVAFTIGDAHVSTVDASTHEMTVTSNGQVVKTIPVSTGRDKYPTKSGIHVVNDKEQTTIMDSSTVGIPVNSSDGYRETVHWNVRISNSGEFVHAAPWSVGSQGRSNVSHGCVNASTADATWFFKFTRLGDVVIVQNTPSKLEPTNGFGDWNVPWAQWAN